MIRRFKLLWLVSSTPDAWRRTRDWKSISTCVHAQIFTRQMSSSGLRHEMTWVSPSSVPDLRWGSEPLIPVISEAGARGQHSGHVTGELSHVPGLYYIYLLQCSARRSGCTLFKLHRRLLLLCDLKRVI